jgi:hypothetical protein
MQHRRAPSSDHLILLHGAAHHEKSRCKDRYRAGQAKGENIGDGEPEAVPAIQVKRSSQ